MEAKPKIPKWNSYEAGILPVITGRNAHAS
jgi:hypothetical protein